MLVCEGKMYDTEKKYIKEISEMIKETWNTPYMHKEMNIPSCIDHTDGIGTKGYYHWKYKTLDRAVMDALAMNLNDMAVLRATPYKLQDHIIIPEDSTEAIYSIINKLIDYCKQKKIAVTGGEISIQNNLCGVEISITMAGYPNDKYILPNEIRDGDVLIGIESSGLHSNGFTRVREIEWDSAYWDELTRSTNIYIDTINNLDVDIHGMMHITGGAFTRLRKICSGLDIFLLRNHILEPHDIFYQIYDYSDYGKSMYKTFNCGIGYIVSVAPEDVIKCLSQIKEFKSAVIGYVSKGNGHIVIESMFSDRSIII